MESFHLEIKGQNGEFIPLQVAGLTDTDVAHIDASGTKQTVPRTACLLCKTQPGQTELLSLSPGSAVEVRTNPDGGAWWPASFVSAMACYVTCVLRHSSEQKVVNVSDCRPAGSSRPLPATTPLRCFPLELPPPPQQQPPPQTADGDDADDKASTGSAATAAAAAADGAWRPTEENIRAELKRCLSGPCLVALLPSVDGSSSSIVNLVTMTSEDAKRLDLIAKQLGQRLHIKAMAGQEMKEISDQLSQAEAARASAQAAAAARRSRLLAKFPVPRRLVGLAMGSGGANADKARQLPGIRSVAYDDAAGVFRIYGVPASLAEDSAEDSVAAARRLLELTDATLRPPSRLVGRLLGKGGCLAQAVVDKAELHNLIVGEEEDAEEAATTAEDLLDDGVDASTSRGSDSGLATADDEADGGIRQEREEEKEELLEREAAVEAVKESGVQEASASEAAEPTTSIRLIGSPQAVEQAKFMLEFQLRSELELDAMERQRSEARAALRAKQLERRQGSATPRAEIAAKAEEQNEEQAATKKQQQQTPSAPGVNNNDNNSHSNNSRRGSELAHQQRQQQQQQQYQQQRSQQQQQQQPHYRRGHNQSEWQYYQRQQEQYYYQYQQQQQHQQQRSWSQPPHNNDAGDDDRPSHSRHSQRMYRQQVANYNNNRYNYGHSNAYGYYTNGYRHGYTNGYY